MAEYYNGINKEEDKFFKFMDKVYDWWNSLTDEKQFDIVVDFYPDEVTEDTNIDKFFGDMANKYQTKIYLANNPDELLTKEEKAQIRYDRGW